MSEMMVRKQIYLPRKQNLLLKRLAKQRGISEAEVIRQALEHESTSMVSTVRYSKSSLNEVFAFVAERKAKYGTQGEPVEWNRDELYEDRENRWFPEQKEE